MSLLRLAACLLAFLAAAASAAEGSREVRVALVIGNGAYKDAPLPNPTNDAADMARTLEALGFKVLLRRNADSREMRQAVREFGAELRRASVGLFYFAGHGIQLKGNNYLVPVGADIQGEADAEDLSIDANYVLRTMEESQVKVSLVILDACRNNPFARGFRSASRGLGQMTAASGSLIAFATAPGSVAADGAGRNGTYTKHLLESLRHPDSDVLKVFQRVRAAVYRETGGRQTPWESTSLIGEFHFGAPPLQQAARAPSAAAEPSAVSQPAPRTTSAEAAGIELTFWQSIRDRNNISDYMAYLERYPSGQFVSLARNFLQRERNALAGWVRSVPRPGGVPAKFETTRSGLPRTYVSSAEKLKQAGPADRIDLLVSQYRQEAEAGDPVAQFSLGSAYRAGFGVEQNPAEASRWFRKAAESGDPVAQHELGLALVNGRGLPKDEPTGLAWLRKAADQGLAASQERIGAAYLTGQGVARDTVEATKWFRMAAEQGNAFGQNNLGVRYALGDGVAKDEAEAARWYRKAADQGNAIAQTNLALFYLQGRGVGKDMAEGVRLLRLAAEQGHPPAMNSLGARYDVGEGVAKDEAEALKWYRRAAEKGYATAQANVGRAHLNGRGVARDQAEGIRWLKLAAQQGEERARAELRKLGID